MYSWIGYIVLITSFDGIIWPRIIKVDFIAAKLRGIARIWWEQYQRSGYNYVARWEDMRGALVRQFKPADYKQRASLRFTELVQGSKSVADYTRQHSIVL